MNIFWAWQSDTPGNIGRHFVRDVLDAAIEHLKSELEVVEPVEREARGAMKLDHDRKGIPGSPDLARTIMAKIEAAAVFVADVTPIGKVTVNARDLEKKLINPNVSVELGYCLRTLTDSRLLMVMNTHYGGREDLPFDIAHKGGPFMFELAPGADRKTIAAAAAKLKAELVEAIRLCVVEAISVKKTVALVKPTAMSSDRKLFAPDNAVLAPNKPGEPPFHFPHKRFAYLRLIPVVSANTTIGNAKVAKIFDRRDACPMSTDVGGTPARNEHGSITFFPAEATGVIGSFTQGFKTGELWGATSRVFAPYKLNNRVTGVPEPQTVIPVVTLEKVFVRTLRNYAQVAGALGLTPPYNIICGIEGTKDAYISVPTGGDFGNGDFFGPIIDKGLRRETQLNAVDDVSIKAVLRNFFNAFYDLAYVERADVWTDALITAHDLPQR